MEAGSSDISILNYQKLLLTFWTLRYIKLDIFENIIVLKKIYIKYSQITGVPKVRVRPHDKCLNVIAV